MFTYVSYESVASKTAIPIAFVWKYACICLYSFFKSSTKLIHFGKMQRYLRLDGLNELLKKERGISVGRMISTAINHIEWPSLCLWLHYSTLI